MNSKTLLLLAVIVLFVGLGWVLLKGPRTNTPKNIDELNPKTEQQSLTVGEKKIRVEVRDDDAERSLGLSYRTQLGENEGMLFIFPQASVHGFWMKGMEFDLDMIWIREGVIVEISKNVPAPKNNGGQIATVNPTQTADWVLEVVGGWSNKNGVEAGDAVILEKD